MTATYALSSARHGPVVTMLWDAFGTTPFTVAACKTRFPPDRQCRWGTTMRDLVAGGWLAATPDGVRLKNGQTTNRYTFTPTAVLRLKRSGGEAGPVCAALSHKGRTSAVRKFFHDRCVHCGAPLRRTSWLAVGTMVLPACRRCSDRIRNGNADYWETCLASLIREKHGGRWRLEGDEVVSKCGTAPADP